VSCGNVNADVMLLSSLRPFSEICLCRLQ